MPRWIILSFNIAYIAVLSCCSCLESDAEIDMVYYNYREEVYSELTEHYSS